MHPPMTDCHPPALRCNGLTAAWRGTGPAGGPGCHARSYRERIPAGTLPIGMDPAGNLILLGVEDPHTGRGMLSVQDHEVAWEAGQTPDVGNVGLAAGSCRDFLASLREP